MTPRTTSTLAACLLLTVPLAATTTLASDPAPQAEASDAWTLVEAQLSTAPNLPVTVTGQGSQDFDPASELATAQNLLHTRASLAATTHPHLTPTLDAQQAHLDQAANLLETLQPSNADTTTAFEHSIQLAQTATQAHAQRLGIELPVLELDSGHALPSQAILALINQHNTPITPELAQETAKLDDLPEPLRTALTSTIDAFSAYDAAATSVYGHGAGPSASKNEPAPSLAGDNKAERAPSTSVNPSAVGAAAPHGQYTYPNAQPQTYLQGPRAPTQHASQAPNVPSALEGVDPGATTHKPTSVEEVIKPAPGSHPLHEQPPAQANTLALVDLLAARNHLLDATVDLREALEHANPLNPATTTASSQPLLDLCPTIAIDTEGTDTTYTDDCALTIDLDGNDTYHNNAGGSTILDNPGCGIEENGAAALIDLNGNDTYGDPLNPRPCGTNGGGFAGAGFLADLHGNDHYTAAGQGTNGGGFQGTGFLLDATGNDHYTAQDEGTNGGGTMGTGLLIDTLGDDTYTAGNTATNGGGLLGTGTLLDATGTDTYTAGNQGANGGAVFGTGLLLDGGGTGDAYTDTDGGSGTDKSVIPKGTTGAQIDATTIPLPNPGDSDGDNVPDALEQELCARPLTAQAIELTDLGTCAASTDWVPPSANHTAWIPTDAVHFDADQDGVPGTITLHRLNITVRPFDPDNTLTTEPGTDITLPLDPDDENPDVPVVSHVRTPTPLIVGATPSADSDTDGFADNVTLQRAHLSWDRRSPTQLPVIEPAEPLVQPIDPFPEDPNRPVQSTFQSPFPIPVWVRNGTDSDQDDLPATVIVDRVNVTVDRRQGLNGITITPAPSVVLPVDDADEDPEDPAPSRVTLPVPIPVFPTFDEDSDEDDVPSALRISRATVTIDRRTGTPLLDTTGTTDQVVPLDPDDGDPNNPAQSTLGPISVPIDATHSGDGDDDYVPGSVTITLLNVTIDRRTQADQNVIINTHEQTTTLDRDDDNRGDPVPLDAFDEDGDLIPDALEPTICLLNDRNRGEDGTCVRADGTGQDGDGNNYVPPVNAPNPWNFT